MKLKYAVVFEQTPQQLRCLRAGRAGLHQHWQDLGRDAGDDSGGPHLPH